MSERIYKQVRDHSFRVAYYILKHHDNAEDIAQIVSLKYLLNEGKVENHITWSSKVAKNESFSLLKAISKTVIVDESLLENFIYKSAMAESEDFIESINLKESEIKKLLSKGDFRVYKSYIKYKSKTSAFAKANKLSYHSASTKVYIMKRNLRAAYLLSKGWKGSKEMISYYMNKKIISFINSFIDKMNQDNLKSMNKYFEFFDIDKITKLDMKEKIDYGIKRLDSNLFEFMLAYFDSSKKPNFCFFNFHLDKRKQIKIVDFQAKPSEVIVSKIPHEELLAKLPKKEKGIIPNNFEDVKRLLDS